MMERDLGRRNKLIDEVTLDAEGNTSKGALSLIEKLKRRKAKAKTKANIVDPTLLSPDEESRNTARSK